MPQALFQPVTDFDQLCQGDIIESYSPGTQERRYGIIITADCDLAQQKAYGELSVLPLLPIDVYMSDIWPSREFSFLRTEIEGNCQKALSLHPALRDRGVYEISKDEVRDWIRTEGSRKIISDLGQSKETSSVEPLLSTLEKMALISEPSKTDIFDLWLSLSKSDGYRKDRIVRAIDPQKGYADIFLLPYLPSLGSIGFVALLRRMEMVAEKIVYRSLAELRQKTSGFAHYRIGRLTDNLRFSLVQRMSNLFARIGHELEFEQELQEATRMLLEDLLGNRTVNA